VKGTPHLQIYAQLTKQRRLGALHREFPGAHIEFSRGTPEQVIANPTYTFFGGFCCGKNTGFLPDFIVRITSVRGESRPQ